MVLYIIIRGFLVPYYKSRSIYKHINLKDLLTDMTFKTFIQHYENAYNIHNMGGGSTVNSTITLSSGVSDIESFKQKINQNVLFQNRNYVSNVTIDEHINTST